MGVAHPTPFKPQEYGIILFIFFTILISHSLSPVTALNDMMFSPYIALSIIKEGNTDLDEYQAVIPADDYRLQPVKGHLYTRYPIGAPLLAVPFMAVADVLSPYLFPQISEPLVEYLWHHPPGEVSGQLEKFTASWVVALTAVLIYLIGRRALGISHALLLVFIFAFCTAAWSTASRGLWQHGPSMLMLTIALYLILLAQEKPFLIQFLAIPLAYSYVIRPTNSISIALLTLFVFIHYRPYFVRYILWAMTIAIPFLAFNLYVYQTPLSWYYLQQVNSNPFFYEALAGTLISPSRGLFIFSPVLLFAIGGVILKIKGRGWQWVDGYLVGIILLTWLAIASWRNWWGGHSIGPRLFSDIVPYMVYFLIPVLGSLVRPLSGPKGLFMASFFSLTMVSFFIQLHSVTDRAVSDWNFLQSGIDFSSARVWDWSNPQFLYGLNGMDAAKASQGSLVSAVSATELPEVAMPKLRALPVTQLQDLAPSPTEDGTMIATGLKPAANFSVNLSADYISTVRVQLQMQPLSQTDSATYHPAALYFRRADQPDFVGEQRLDFTLVADGNRHSYDLSPQILPDWTGTIAEIQVVPIEHLTVVTQSLFRGYFLTVEVGSGVSSAVCQPLDNLSLWSPIDLFILPAISGDTFGLNAQLSGPHPQLFRGFNVPLQAEAVDTLDIYLQSQNIVQPDEAPLPVTGSLYFHPQDQNFDEVHSFKFNWIPNNKPQQIRIDLKNNPNWQGVVTGLRLDPVLDPGQAATPFQFTLGRLQFLNDSGPICPF